MIWKDFFTGKRLWAGSIALIGLASSIIGIYEYFKKNNPSIQFQLINSSNVFELNENITKLDVNYNNTSLKKLNQNLRVIDLKIVNNGEQDLLKIHYDENDPLGFLVKNGRIAEKPVITFTSSQYLKSQLFTKLIGSNKVILPNVILDISDSFIIKILIIHPKNITPEIISTGKIAGIKRIEVVDLQSIRKEKDFIDEIITTNITRHIERVAFYLSISISIIFSFIIIIELISRFYKWWQRRRIVSKFKKTSIYDFDSKYNFIFNIYVKWGFRVLSRTRMWTNNDRAMTNILKNVNQGSISRKIKSPTNLNIASAILANRYVTINNDQIIVDNDFKEKINSFSRFVIKLKHS